MLNIEKENCCGCSACIHACPKHCISFETDEEGFAYPEIERSSCVQCGLCKKVCPFQIGGSAKRFIPEAYGIKALDSNILKESSSGGAFTLLAEKIIEKKGIVYGAAMKFDMKGTHHIRVSSLQNLYLLRGSKYLQSEMGDCFKMVKEDLDHGRVVLFSGVPCQINGLRLYLNKSYDKLFCLEIICHGVPSPLLWRKYVQQIETQYKSKVLKVNFRNKKFGWNQFGLSFDGENISQYRSLEQDSYLQIFLKNYCLRPSCYSCSPKTIESMADITIADFWGVRKILPKLDDDRGTSLVLIQSDKGKELFEEVKDLMVYYAVDFKEAIQSNPAYYQSAVRPLEREYFFKELELCGYKAVAKKYGHMTAKEALIKIFGKTLLLKLYLKIKGRLSKCSGVDMCK